MKILMISPSYGSKVGGAENQLKKLHKKLDNKNIHIFSKKTSSCSDFFYPYNFNFKILRHIVKKNYNIIHIHTFSSPAWIIALLNLFFKKKILIKITLSGNNSRLEKINSNLLFKVIFNFFFNSKNIYFVSINANIKKILIKNGIKNKNIFNIPNGVEISSNRTVNKKEIDLIYFGRLIKRKNIFNILNIINERKLEKLKFHIYGEGPERKKIKSYIKENNLKNVFLNNFKTHNEIIKKLKKSKFSINASDAEGMSNSILESLAAAVPVICSNIYENKYLIRNKYNGYIFNNSEKLYKILKYSIKSKNYKKISSNAYYSIKKYDINRIVNIYKKKYYELFTKS